MEHIAFAVKLCLLQAKLGRKFMIEQPVGANSWGTQLMNKLLFVKNAGKVNFDSCMFDMMSDDHHGIGHAKKRTSIITNSEALLTEMKNISAMEDIDTSRFWGGKPRPVRLTPTNSAS